METMHINRRLAERMELNEDSIRSIDKLQTHLNNLLTQPHIFVGSPDMVPQIITETEHQLQLLWGFPQDPKFHKYNHRIMGCTCPTTDNDCMVGYTNDRWHNHDCPYHGVTPATSWDDERLKDI